LEAVSQVEQMVNEVIAEDQIGKAVSLTERAQRVEQAFSVAYPEPPYSDSPLWRVGQRLGCFRRYLSEARADQRVLHPSLLHCLTLRSAVSLDAVRERGWCVHRRAADKWRREN
jgi:hypothetical protein